MEEMSVLVVPQPQSLRFSGRWFVFDGFEDFPEFIAREFGVPRGDWRIVRAEQDGTGLRVGDKAITIWGNESICFATILQLANQRRGHIPEVEVLESLRFGFRGFHLDVARGGVPNIETFKRILRQLFLLKYNHFAVYFEDLFPWKKYPEIGKHRGRLTEEELRTVMDYGSRLGIEVFPSLELSGHMEHILSLPNFQDLSEWHRPAEGCLDLSSQKAKEFAYGLLEEVVGFFPSRYIHIGGDETWALGRGRSLNKTWSFRGPELYESHHRNMVEIVKRDGKEPVLWGDMISGMHLKDEGRRWSKVMGSEIWKEVLVANWDYSSKPREYFVDKIRIFKDRAIPQIVCPGLSNWNRYYPNFQTALGNLRSFLEAAKQEEVVGFMVTAWGDDGEECLFSFLEPLLLAAMEIAEGDSEWERKWIAISGEDEEVLRVRRLLGDPDISDALKHVVFRDLWFQRLSPERRESIRSLWEKTLKAIGDTCLPEDLDFTRRLLEIGLKIFSNDVKVSDYIMLCNLYSRIWLRERKPEGLERIVERLWAAAGRKDMEPTQAES